MSIFKFFDHTVDYPDIAVNDILPCGELWWYVSDTFVNGFVNYSEILAAFIADERGYLTQDEIDAKAKRFNETLPDYHTKLCQFGTNVWLLGKSIRRSTRVTPGAPSEVFWLYYFNQDTSDCGVGRFVPPVGITSYEVATAFWEHMD
jgi:hypothetical protein